MVQHYFHGASRPIYLSADDLFYAWVYLDAENPPEDRALVRGMGLELARQNALECLSRTDPRLIPAPEEGTEGARDSRWLECTARSWKAASLPPGVAWGRDLAEVAGIPGAVLQLVGQECLNAHSAIYLSNGIANV